MAWSRAGSIRWHVMPRFIRVVSLRGVFAAYPKRSFHLTVRREPALRCRFRCFNRSLSGEEAKLSRASNCLGPAADLQPREDIAHVALGGGLRNDQHARDIVVRCPISNQTDDFLLARS